MGVWVVTENNNDWSASAVIQLDTELESRSQL